MGVAALVLGCASGGEANDPPGGLSGVLSGSGSGLGPLGETSDGADPTEPNGVSSGSDAAESSSGGDESGPPPDDEPEPGGDSGGDADPEPLPPALPTCGDAALDPGEQCDDGNVVDGDACVHCQNARCGDGVQYLGTEQCDDGNGDNGDACLSSCEAASCGDAVLHDGVEVCDDGTNNGSYGGCMPSCAALAPHCGDGDVTASEQCDPEDQLPFDNVECADDTCLYDFGGIPQLYCNGTCSWAGGYGCDQADADVLCQLVTGDASSTASDYDLAYTQNAPGFACPGVGVNMGTMPEFGVNLTVWYQDFNLIATHGAGVVVVNPTCT